MSEQEIYAIYPEFFYLSMESRKPVVRPDCAPWVDCLQRFSDCSAFVEDIYFWMRQAMILRDLEKGQK